MYELETTGALTRFKNVTTICSITKQQLSYNFNQLYILIKTNNIANGAHLIGTLLGQKGWNLYVQNMTDDELKLLQLLL